jgi:di/tricarboxylate transporter
MTGDMLLTLGVTVAGFGLFLWGRLRVDVVGLILMTTLMVTGVLTLREGVSGFANEAMITVAAMFVLSSGMVRTGAIDLLGGWLARIAGKSELRLLLASMALVIPLSAFVNNTPVIVVMIPLVLGIAGKIGARPSKLFMPLSFASQMGGTLTLIGTSTNLLVAGLVLELGLPRITLFQITPAAAVLMVVGVVYLLTLGRWLTPERKAHTDLEDAYDLRDYVTALELEEDSPLLGKSLGEARFAQRYGFEVVAIERRRARLEAPGPDTVLEARDVLLARGKIRDIAQLQETDHLRIARARGLPQTPLPWQRDEDADEATLAELLVPPGSRVVGRTLRMLGLRDRFQLELLGMRRSGAPLPERFREVPLAVGDLVLVQAVPDSLRRIHEGREFALIGAVTPPVRRRRLLKVAVPIMVGVVLLAAFAGVPILLSAMLGVVAMFVTGCVTPEEAYEDVDWMVLVLLGSIIPLGLAMQKTGAAAFVAERVLALASPIGLHGLLGGLYLLTSLMTEVISNNAAAVLLTPIAVATAQGLGVSPLPFIIAVMLAASNSFMTPIGYQTNTFVYGPGGYRFGDFFRVGGPLNLLLVIAATWVIPRYFPF